MSEITLVDGSLDFSGGVNSNAVATVQSERNPNGIRRNQVCWMSNATVRNGGITQRTGWRFKGNIKCDLARYQGSFMYSPLSEDNPYIVSEIGGKLYQIDVDDPEAAVELTAGHANLVNPSDVEISYFEQAEQFLIIQAGDYNTQPLFWDGTTLRRSNGLQYAINITSVNFNAPAIGVSVLLTLTVGYQGEVNQIIIIDNARYVQVDPANSWTLRYTQAGGASVGLILPVGTEIEDLSGNVIATSLAPFVVPAVAAVTATVYFAPFWTGGALPQAVRINGENWNVETVNVLAAPAANQVWVVNINDVAATVHNAPTTLLSEAELPAAGPMVYYMNRLWYAQGRLFSAGDIVGGPSGTIIPRHEDAVLKVTENPLAVGGDGFTVPGGAGNIRCLTYAASVNSALGQGQLVIGTREQVFGMTVPVTRTDWIGANTDNGPLQTVLQMGNGTVNQRSVTAVNGDLFFQSFEPSVRSLMMAIRYFDQWGNTPISINEDRILKFNDRSLMRFSSGILFDNRMLQAVLPHQVPVGVAHQAVIPLNFDVISTLESKLPPVWEGMYEGLDILELIAGDFGGLQRSFAIAWSEKEQQIQLWEMTVSDRFERDDNRVSWYVEFPAFTFGNELELKKLVSAELWLDKLYGTVYFQMDYRPDGDPCWYPWHRWELCTARNTCENVHNPEGCTPYPEILRESYIQMITLPKPDATCAQVMGRPSYIGYQFQCRLTIKGWCRIRGLLLKAEKVESKLYQNLVCK